MSNNTNTPPDSEMIISYLNMRRIIGYLAIGLPVATSVGYMIVGAQHVMILDSISEYYYTVMRDVFVGALCMVGLFLIAYRGYNVWEDRLFNFAAGLCFCIALFSMDPQYNPGANVREQWCYCTDTIKVEQPCDSMAHINLLFKGKVMLIHRSSFGLVHDVSAGLLFIILGVVSFFFFTQSDQDKSDKATFRRSRKFRRNVLYYICGAVIWATLAFYVFGYLVPQMCHRDSGWVACLTHGNILFWVELVCLWAFGISWLVKGEGIGFLNDLPGTPKDADKKDPGDE